LILPENLFQSLDKETGKESTCILRYDSMKGKWEGKYPFFGRAAGHESKLEREGYIVYFQKP
jgi:hypothetical protein